MTLLLGSTHALSRLWAPNTLPPGTPQCLDNPNWVTPAFNPKDCYTALARFQVGEVEEHSTSAFEFLAPGTTGITVFPRRQLPRKYPYGTPLFPVGSSG